MTTEARVKEIIAEQLGVDIEQVTDNANLMDDLGADSLDTVELVLALEEEFDIDIDDAQADELVTVIDVVTKVTELAM